MLSASLPVLMPVFSFQFTFLNARLVGDYVAVSTEAAYIVTRAEGFVAGIGRQQCTCLFNYCSNLW